MIIEIPMPIPSLANISGHWSKKYVIKKNQCELIKYFIKKEMFKEPPVLVILTRCSRRLLDFDNLYASMKYVIDCIADIYHPGLAPGMADGLKEINFDVNQEISKIQKLKVEIV